MSFFGKNIRKIRNVRNMSQQAFADIFDLKRGTLGAYEEGRSEPRIETILKIANYFSISTDDLLTMELTVNQLLKFKGDFSLKVEKRKNNMFAKIPCITDENLDDYLVNYKNPHFVEELPLLQLPINSDKIFRAYTVNNLEMTDHDRGLYPKDVVVGEFVPQEVYSKLNNGNIVLAYVGNQLVLRRLYVTKNKITLRADHKGIDDLFFKLNEIKEIWKIRYVFYRRVPELNVSHNLEDKLSFLEQEFLKLKERNL